jgi:hypothetical protein
VCKALRGVVIRGGGKKEQRKIGSRDVRNRGEGIGASRLEETSGARRLCIDDVGRWSA